MVLMRRKVGCWLADQNVVREGKMLGGIRAMGFDVILLGKWWWSIMMNENSLLAEIIKCGGIKGDGNLISPSGS